MRIFISWSGDESRQIAEALREWLPMMFESVEPYMSARDNEAGVRWGHVISAALDESGFGILCMTPTNLNAAWVLFEAGALSKSVDSAKVVPLLWRVSTTDVRPPLSQFQMKPADKAGVFDLVKSINGTLERHRSDAALAGAFEALWPQLYQGFARVQPADGALVEVAQRSERDLLEEILEVVRQQAFDSDANSLMARLRYDRSERQRFLDRVDSLLPTGFEKIVEIDDKGYRILIQVPREATIREAQAVLDSVNPGAAQLGMSVRLTSEAWGEGQLPLDGS